MRRIIWTAFYLGLFCLTLIGQQSCAQDCDAGWFGSTCKFKCHCSGTVTCGDDGSCSSGCERGWFGPRCQYVDLVATKSPASTLPDWLYNNDCYRQYGPFEVTLTEQIPFTWLRIHIDHAAALQNIIATLYNNGSLVTCRQKRVSVNNEVEDIYCDQQVMVDKVKLSGAYVYYLCSVFISGGRNVALKQTTSQSTDYQPYQSSNAVDGNTVADFNQGTCTHTSTTDPNPSWSVSFLKPQMVNRYVIYNRNGQNKDRLQGFSLTSYQASQTQLFQHTDTGSPLLVYDINVEVAANTSPTYKVTITTRSNQPVLTICEFEAYGDCAPPNYGLECNSACSQGCSSDCAATGECYPCKAGWQGHECESGCSPTTYGPGCTSSCSSNCVNRECNAANGKCNSCPAGKKGDYCTEGCSPTTYGPGCAYACSSNCVNRECNAVNGKCISCPAGKKGDYCTEVCSAITYGPGCTLSCSSNCVNRRCNAVSGRCNACPAGKKGDYCEEACSPTTYGPRCISSCSFNCVNRECNAVNGKCNSCPAGKKGDSCTEACSSYCANTACNQDTGYCSPCKTGWMGSRCSQMCYVTYFGPNCSQRCNDKCEDQRCDHVTGVCDACPPGKIGDQCDQDCQDTYYGINCQQTCSTNCKDQLCQKAAGECFSCIAGKRGTFCNQNCSATTYGANCALPCSLQCKDGKCNSVTGYCGDCPAGKMGQQCSADCPPTKHGAGCLENCSVNCIKNICEGDTGICTDCPDGRMLGGLCTEVCLNGTFGHNCSGTCNTNCGGDRSCFPENGTCVFECADGYSGHMCTEKLQTPGVEPATIGAIVGAILAAIVITLLIVLGVFMWKRRRNPKKDNTDTSATYANAAAIASLRSNKAFSENDALNDAKQNESTPLSPSDTVQSATVAPVTASKPAVKPKPPAKPRWKLNGKNGEAEKSRIYYNTVKDVTKSSTSVAVGDLATFMASRSNNFFVDQYKSIPNNETATTAVGTNDHNRHKNRYKNIVAYDHSRVHLIINESKNQGDYINASYIEGYKGEEKFIATQGPTKIILEDFIRLLWEQKVDKVVMLTNLIEEGKSKCEMYWPQNGEMEIDDIKITPNTTEVFADYTIRRMQLSKKGEGHHDFIQFHFTSWPDKGVPTTPWPLVDFEQRVASTPTNRPIVVHCSAGVGRTGTFIALRNVMREAEDSGHMDFFRTVENMRKDRVNMVQTAEQYEFIHKAAHVAIICMGTTVTANDILQRVTMLESKSKSGQSNMENEFKAICAACDDNPEDYDKEDADSNEEVYNVYQNSRSMNNKLKNRLTNILPKDYYRVRLMAETSEMGDYINAVYVPSFRKQNQQILTQLPLPLTVTDFWRLVTQNKVTLIVAFEVDLKDTDPTVADYLPPDENEPLKVPLFSITSGPITSGDLWEKQRITVTAEDRKGKPAPPSVLVGEHFVTHLKCTLTGYDPAQLLSLIKQIKSLNPVGEGRTVYMCRNGADYSGLVCVLSLLLDRMDNDHRLTVPLVVGAIKAIRPQVIPTLEQYRALYQVLKEYNDTSNIYNN